MIVMKCCHDFDRMGHHCHSCAGMCRDHISEDEPGGLAVKAYAEGKKLKFLAIASIGSNRGVLLALSAPLSEADIDSPAIRGCLARAIDNAANGGVISKTGFPGEPIRRLCLIMDPSEVKAFVEGWDVQIDFQPLVRRLAMMEKDMTAIQDMLYSIGESQTCRAVDYLKEHGEHRKEKVE